MPTISIIVPVYNGEKYLSKCIDSILAQTYTTFELLLVDDGSPDRSGVICDEYAAHDPRIRVFHKGNGGVSSARNLGLDNARGERIAFVDADDSVSPTYIEHLMDGNIEYDLCVSGFRFIYKDGEKEEHNAPDSICLSHTEIGKSIPRLEYKYLLNGPVQKLFKRCIIEDNSLRFDESISHGEDTLFVLNYMTYVNTMKVSSMVDYDYFKRSSDSLSKRRSPIHIARHFANKMYLLRKKMIKRYFIEDEIYRGYLNNLYLSYLFVGLFSLYYKRINKSVRHDFISKIKSDLKSEKINFYIDGISVKNFAIRAILMMPVCFADQTFRLMFKLLK